MTLPPAYWLDQCRAELAAAKARRDNRPTTKPTETEPRERTHASQPTESDEETK